MTDPREQPQTGPSGTLSERPVQVPGDPVAPPPARRSVATDVALVATFAAFIAVCALLPPVPTGGLVNITLQTFGVMLAGLVLGPRRGALAVLLYLAAGAAGAPVFSGGASGLAVLAGPSGGYLIGFPLGAWLAGSLATRAQHLRPGVRYWALFGSAMAGSLLFIHTLGIAGLVLRGGMSLPAAIVFDAGFLPGDIIKNLFAALVATAIFRAFPDLLRNRR